MSVKIEHRVGVAAPADRIWDLLSDLPGWRDWNPVHPEVNGRLAIGATLDVVEQLEGRSPRRLVMTVEDWVPNAQILWKGRRGPLARSIRFIEIEQLSETGCIFANGELYEGVVGDLIAKRNRRLLKRAFAAMGEAVKARVEGGAAQPPV